MKKVEAQEIAPSKSRLIIEYINQFLSSPNPITAKICIDSDKIEKENMCTFELYEPSQNFERHYNSEIASIHSDVLIEQILTDLVETFMDSDSICLGYFYTFRSNRHAIDGINITNLNGSKVILDFLIKGEKFNELTHTYNNKLSEYAKNQQLKM